MGTEKGAIADLALLRQVLDWALTLHQRLPEAPAASSHALHRLARYQATARLYWRPSMVRTFRARLGGAGEIAFQHVSFSAFVLPAFYFLLFLSTPIRCVRSSGKAASTG